MILNSLKSLSYLSDTNIQENASGAITLTKDVPNLEGSPDHDPIIWNAYASLRSRMARDGYRLTRAEFNPTGFLAYIEILPKIL